MTRGLADTSHARRVAIASAVGTIIEFYEFSIYATAAALVFSQTFFPSRQACSSCRPQGAAYGPLAAYLPESFATQYRYTGAGLAYSIATVLGASLTPIIATILVDSYGVWTVTVYLAALVPRQPRVAVREP